tara:strand:+ start:3301 stop:3546 length:246 start_codon:yes stop_codon:yes gene_type:complete
MVTNNKKSKVLPVEEWLITKFLILIPIVNIILLLFWAFNEKQNLNKSNWAKATLIIYGIKLIFYAVIIFSFLSFFMSLFII